MKILLIGLVALFLTNCAGVKQIESVKVAVAKTPLDLEQPAPIETLEVEWYVINDTKHYQ